MSDLKIYRKRFIPSECILLKDDVILFESDEHIITQWNTLNPKTSFSRGCSCYFLKRGWKVSKFYRPDNSLLYWYCDIVDYSLDKVTNTLTVSDLLADVILYPDGSVSVVDLDELADALDDKLITSKQMSMCLNSLQDILNLIHTNQFHLFQDPLDSRGL